MNVSRGYFEVLAPVTKLEPIESLNRGTRRIGNSTGIGTTLV
jgi:hypothetical protein